MENLKELSTSELCKKLNDYEIELKKLDSIHITDLHDFRIDSSNLDEETIKNHLYAVHIGYINRNKNKNELNKRITTIKGNINLIKIELTKRDGEARRKDYYNKNKDEPILTTKYIEKIYEEYKDFEVDIEEMYEFRNFEDLIEYVYELGTLECN